MSITAPRRSEPADGRGARRRRGLAGLSGGDWLDVLKRAARSSLDDELPMIASAVAYSSFFAIPSVLLLAVGLFSLFSSPDTVAELMDRLSAVMPAEATQLLGDSLRRMSEQNSASLVIAAVGLVLAVWSVTSAMTTYMSALNTAYDREDGRGFARKRLVALTMAVVIALAALLVGVLLIFGPHVEHWLGDALGVEGALSWAWWIAQWPILAVGLLAAFATLLFFGPDVEHRRWQFVTPGSLVTLVLWLLTSGAFALYTSYFASYNKTWGSLSAVIVTLTWLWLTALALLFGGEVNAEVEREVTEGEADRSVPTRSGQSRASSSDADRSGRRASPSAP
jgi:membrane protein